MKNEKLFFHHSIRAGSLTLSRSMEPSLLSHIQTFIVATCSFFFKPTLIVGTLAPHYNSLEDISCFLQKTQNLVVISLKCLKLEKIHHPLK